MSRQSQTFLPTLKDPPADAEAVSHKLMVRAGLIRQLGAGLWTYLPAGWRVERMVEGILREEMEAIGCQEMLMPVLQPAENWQKTGRYGIEELFKLEDRKGSPMVLAMTHEEAITYHVAREVRSYRDLPLMLFHIQTKERDEPRPRAGVLRTREFTMKDAYSFDRDEEGLAAPTSRRPAPTTRILDRCGLRWYRVESDVGMMGGSGADEYMAPCPAGENEVALAPGYAANVEVASADAQPVELPPTLDAPEPVDTPGLAKVEEVATELGLPHGAFIKALPVVVEDRGLVMVLLRGDHRLNEIKLRNALGAGFRQASAEEIEAEIGPPGYIGPVGAEVPVIKDAAIDGDSFVTGANQPDTHLRGVRARARLPVRGARRAHGRGRRHRARRRHDRDRAGDRGRQHLQARHAVTRSRSAPPTSTRTASERPIVMGSYGIGPGADRRRRDRAARRRARHRLAARRWRPGASTWSRWRRPGSPSARPPTSSTRSCATPAPRCSTTTATPGRGRS